MADFKQALDLVLKNEGGWVEDPKDPGGSTYKGVSRNNWPSWQGWLIIDDSKKYSNFPKSLDSNSTLQDLVAQFYKENFWDKIGGDGINSQVVASCIFDFAVNAGVGTSNSLATLVAPDINAIDPELFLNSFTIAKIARYITICKKRPESKKYFFGWVSRALGDIKN